MRLGLVGLGRIVGFHAAGTDAHTGRPVRIEEVRIG
jgi:hypothetical protein